MTRMSRAGQLRENPADAPAIVGRDEEALRVSCDVRELAARFADGRRVDERHDSIDVIDDRLKEQILIPLLQRRQQHVAIDVARQPIQVRHHAVHHLPTRGHPIGQQAAQAQPLPLVASERDGLVPRLVTKDLKPAFHGVPRIACTIATTTGPQIVRTMLPIAYGTV